MYWFGIVLLAIGVVLLGFSNPWQFFQAAEGSFLDWTEAFWYLQWWGFWMVAASLLVFGVMAWAAPATYAIRWKILPPGIAIVIFALFFVYSMPEKSNQRDWKNGWLGARLYWRTKLWMRGDDAGEDALPSRMAGLWEAPGGFSFSLTPDRIQMTSPSGASVWSAQTCRGRFEMRYDFTLRYGLSQPVQNGLRFSRFEKAAAPTLPLPNRRFPELSCSCDEKFATFVLVDIDRLLVFRDFERTALVARRR